MGRPRSSQRRRRVYAQHSLRGRVLCTCQLDKLLRRGDYPKPPPLSQTFQADPSRPILLFTLPRELRDSIYSLCLAEPTQAFERAAASPHPLSKPTGPSLFVLNKQISSEAMDLFYHCTYMALLYEGGWWPWTQLKAPLTRRLLQSTKELYLDVNCLVQPDSRSSSTNYAKLNAAAHDFFEILRQKHSIKKMDVYFLEPNNRFWNQLCSLIASRDRNVRPGSHVGVQSHMVDRTPSPFMWVLKRFLEVPNLVATVEVTHAGRSIEFDLRELTLARRYKVGIDAEKRSEAGADAVGNTMSV